MKKNILIVLIILFFCGNVFSICYDITGDNKVNIFDLVKIAIDFGKTNVPSDVDNSGKVGLEDLRLIAFNHGICQSTSSFVFTDDFLSPPESNPNIENSNKIIFSNSIYSPTENEGQSYILGTVAHWPLESSVIDLTGNGTNGSLEAGATFTNDGKTGKAIYLDGVTNYAIIPSTEYLKFKKNFSVSFWAKTNDTGYFINTYEGYGSGSYYFQVLSNGTVKFYADDDSDRLITSSNSIHDNQYHHFVGIRDGSTGVLKFYIDGSLMGTTSCGTNDFMTYQSGRMLFGTNYSFSSFLNASIDEVMIFNKALSESEINLLNSGTLGQNYFDGDFTSKNIYSGPAYGINVSWKENNKFSLLELSTDDGETWCSVENGESLSNELCPLGASKKIKYRIFFVGETSLDSITIRINTEGSICGNGLIESGEECDDSDTTQGDGCSNECVIEQGYECVNEPSTCARPESICGNNEVEYGEQCDDGNQNNNDGCSSECEVEGYFSGPIGFGGIITPNINSINPEISVSRETGLTPFVLQVSAMNTTAGGVERPYEDLEYTWNFGNSLGTETFEHPVTGSIVNANSDQKGPEAAYVYREPGEYTITLRVKGWNGTSFIEETKTKQIIVEEWTGETGYLDVDTLNETRNGVSEDTAWSSWSEAVNWLVAQNNRKLLIKRGTTVVMTKPLTTTKSHQRVGAYGTGARPIISGENLSSTMFLVWGNVSAIIDDQVYQDIELDGKGKGNTMFNAILTTLGKSKGGDLYNIYVLDSTFRNDGSGSPVILQSSVNKMGFWNTDFIRNNTAAQGIYAHMNQWFFVVGGSFFGGNGNIIRDHHIYPSKMNNALYRWIEFGTAKSMNFCINSNANGSELPIDYTANWLIDGIDCYGTSNGLDWGVGNPSGMLYGGFDNFILQNSKIHGSGYLENSTGQGYSLLGERIKKLTIRDNSFYSTLYNHYQLTSPELELKMYRNDFYADASNASMINFGNGGVSGEVYDNTFMQLGPLAAYRGMIVFPFSKIEAWEFERNKYWSPVAVTEGEIKVFDNKETTERKTFAEWQSELNYDLQGAEQNPNWTNPSNGNFN